MKRSVRTSLCAVLTALCLLFSAAPLSGFLALPVPARAQAAEIVASGSNDRDIYWTLDNAGTLTISGGAGPWDLFFQDRDENYSQFNAVPWPKDQVRTFRIETGITLIEAAAFSGCTQLREVQIADSVTSIGNEAFSGCTALTNVTIPDSVTSIGASAFYNCTGLTNIKLPNNETSIGSYAFYNCTGLTGITIPNGVTSIGASAFVNCTGLSSITIPNSVTSIGASAFANCTGLSSITIPNSVTSIGNWAFSGCTGLEEISVENDAVEIGDYAFYNTAWYQAQPDGPVYIGNTLYKYKGSMPSGTSVTIRPGTKIIGESAFSNCKGLTDVTIPSSVTSIGSNAFLNCTGLTDITIPNGVTNIGSAAFEYCTGLTDITIPNSVTSIKNSTFYGCTGLTSVTIPYSVTNIGDFVFYDCTGLTSVTIPNSVTSIGSRAFYNCTGLNEISVENDATEIGWKAFHNTAWYEAQPDGMVYIAKTAYAYKGKMPQNTEITIKNGTLKLEDSLFYNSSYDRPFNNLIKVTIPNSVLSIGKYVFYECFGLSSITIPNSVTSIGDYAFYNCSGLTGVTIPNSVTDIGEYAFSGCSAISSFTVAYGNPVYHSAGNCIIETENKKLVTGCKNSVIPANGSVTSIGDYAFSGCAGLTSVTIPNGVTSIGHQAFSECTGLTGVTISNSVTSIGFCAFAGCTGLTGITVPGSVRQIRYSTFENCKNLKSVNIAAGVTHIGNGAFQGCRALSDLSLPHGLVYIGADAFRSGLSSIVIPNSVTSIGCLAFSGLNSITVEAGNPVYHSAGNCVIKTETKELIIGSNTGKIPADGSVTSIGDYAFSGCTELTDITIPNSVTSIGEEAFSGCEMLMSITIPGSVTNIGNEAFLFCSGLTSVTIPNSVTSIGDYAFYGCDGIRIFCYQNSYAADYASSNHLLYYYLDAVAEDDIANGTAGNLTWVLNKRTGVLTISGSGDMDDYYYASWYTSSPNNPPPWASYPQYINTAVISDGVTSIGNYAFYNCSLLMEVSIADSVAKIGDYAFRDCSRLKDVTINSDAAFGSYVFMNCQNVKRILFGRNVTTIDVDTFKDMQKRSELNTAADNPVFHAEGNCIIKTDTKTLVLGCNNSIIPSDGSVTRIDSYAFSGLDGLKSILIPDSVTYLGSGAFSGCTGLTSIAVPKGQWSIGYYVFRSCSNLASVTIPASVKRVYESSFYGCSSLQRVCYEGSAADWDGITIDKNNDPLLSAKKYYNYAQEGAGVGYIIEFDANGGTGAPGYQAKGEGAVLTLTTEIPFKTNTLIFNANGGSVSPASKSLDCTFKNWNTQADGNGSSYPAGGSYTADEDATLYAQWIAPAAGSLPEPTRGGYVFNGWYTAAEGGTLFTKNDTVPRNMTVYAHWEKLKTYTVTYDANGGTGAPAAQTKTQGEPLTLRTAVPTKYLSLYFNANGGSVSPASKSLDCTFKNWNTQADGNGSSYPAGGSYAADEDATLYAQWIDPVAGSLPEPTRGGYTFAGWYTAAEGGTPFTENDTVPQNITLYAHWEKLKTYTVSYSANGGVGAPAQQTKTQGEPLTLRNAIPAKYYTIYYNANGGAVTTVSKAVECTFYQWNTQENGGGNAYAPGDTYTEDASATLYAQWIDPMAGALTVPTRADYTFTGWFTEPEYGVEITEDTVIISDLTVYAHWKKNPNKYTVSYNAGGGSGAPDSQTKTENVPLTLSSKIPAKEYTLTFNPNGSSVYPASKPLACAFTEWNTQPGGGGASYAPGGVYTANASVTLYAQWTNPTAGYLPTPTKSGYTFGGWYTSPYGGSEVTADTEIASVTTVYARWAREPEKYTVSYNANGGVGAPDPQTKEENVALVLSDVIPSCDYTLTFNAAGGYVQTDSKSLNCTFRSWNTSPDGAGVSYAPGGSYHENASAVLYALWASPAAGALPVPTRGGYIFTGWYTAASGGAQVTESTNITRDTVLYAHWKEKQVYTVTYNANGGSGAPEPQYKTEGDPIQLSSEEPEKAYTLTFNANGGSVSVSQKTLPCWLRSWNTSANGLGVSYYPGDRYAADASVTLYAQWSNPAAGDLPTPTRSGWNFAGWYTSPTGGSQIGSTTQINLNSTVYAHWTNAQTYTVTYSANGGYGAPADQTKLQDTPLLLSTEKPVKSYSLSYNACGGSVSPSGKTVSCVFKNWNTAADGSGASYEPGGSYTANANATLYARWANPTAGSLPTPVREGYTFTGWYTAASGGTQFTAGSAVTGNTTLFAHWTASSYTATFKINGGKWANGSSEATRTLTYTTDNTLVAVFPQNNGVNWPFIRSSYVFAGWKVTGAGGNWRAGKIYSDNWLAHETGMYGDVTFEAQWTYAPNTYTVAYNANGGTGTPSTQSKIQDVTLMISEIRPTKSYTISYNAAGGSVSPASKSVNCTFKNWNTSADGSGATYHPGGNYTANANATLYAQWKNPAAGALATPTRSGYLFAGWFTAASGGTKVTESTTLTANVTLYAHWNTNSNVYNLGEETYSFANFSDSDAQGGHCFGMSMTSAGYYNGYIDIARIGGNAATPLYSFSNTAQVKRPICYYQGVQGTSALQAMVAGGSAYKNGLYDIYSDWIDVVNYVKDHTYDNTGRLQIGFRKGIGGHAINFLRYENVNGQDRIYAYDNNFPFVETYFYQDSEGNVLQAPMQTFNGAIDCIALRDIDIYFSVAAAFDASHALYVENDAATVQGYTYSYMEGALSGSNYVMYEIPSDVTQVKIIPNKDNADFIYMDTEYSFGTITDGTYGILEFASLNEYGSETEANFTIYTETVDPEPTAPGDVDNDGKITASDARLALRRAVDLETYAEGSPEYLACDIDGDGKVTASDARIILRIAVDLEKLEDYMKE